MIYLIMTAYIVNVTKVMQFNNLQAQSSSRIRCNN